MVLRTPALPALKAAYLRERMQQVEGWLSPSTACYLSGLEVLQRDLPMRGGVCEIGIHHGKSFLCLAVGLPESDPAVAIDVFDDQEQNIDGSGRGDRAVFEMNLSQYGVAGRLEVVQASSLDLSPGPFVDAGRRFRLFSIDGSHTIDATVNDLRLAELTIVPGGVVILDDLLNPQWLGVMTGLFRYWAEGGALVPAAVVPGKLLLTSSEADAVTCRKLMREAFPEGLKKADVPLGDGEVDFYDEGNWLVVDESGDVGPLAGWPTIPRQRRNAATMDRKDDLIRELSAELAGLRDQASTEHAAVRQSEHARVRFERKLEQVYESTTWKVGSTVLWLPKKVRDVARSRSRRR